MHRLHFLPAALVLVAPLASAQSFYAGGSLGYAHLETGSPGVILAISGPSFTPPAVDVEMSPAGGGRIFAGVDLNRWLSLEVDYARLGTISAVYAYDDPATTRDFSDTSRGRLDAFAFSAVARAAASDEVWVFGRAGVARTSADYDIESCSSTGGFVPTPTVCSSSHQVVSQTGAVLGAGLDWRFSERFTARFGWDRYFGVGKEITRDANGFLEGRGKFDVDLFTAGVYYRF